MLGVGVGFDTKGAGSLYVNGVNAHLPPIVFQVPDSREGWVEALRLNIDAHVVGRPAVKFDFSKVRPAGQPIRGFGGISSGPGALENVSFLNC